MTGVENDFIIPDSCNFVSGDSLPMPKMVPLQKSFDHHLNDHSKTLLELCKFLDMWVLNGRCKGDSFGKITFYGHQGISTVDYILASHELLDIFQNFIVRQPSHFSDHCQLVGWIKIYDTPSNSPSDNQQELVNRPRQFKWSLDCKE